MPITITGAAVTGGALITVPSTTAGDPYFPYVPLLLNTTSTNAQTNNSFLDSSASPLTITRNGTPTQGSITPYWPDGQWSNYFAANGDYISVPDAANLELGASDFQMSAWVYLTAYPASNLGSYASAILNKGIFSGTRSYTFSIDGASGTTLALSLINTGATQTYITGSFSFALNTWYAVRATRVSNRVYLFVNGNLLNTGGTAYTDTVSNTTDVLRVGRANLDVNYVFQLFGYVSNVSLAIGGSGYSTANYTPATTPTTATSDIKFLSCQSNRFRDNSSVPATVSVFGTPRVQAFQPFSPAASYTTALYGGSGYFPSSGSSYLSSTITALSNTFVVMECWVYNNSLDNSQGNHYLQIQNGAATNYALTHDANGTARFLSRNDSSGAIFDITAASVIKTNQWQYIVGMRNATTASLYVDGVRVGTASVSVSTTSGTSLYISGNAGTTRLLDGYMANARIISGSLPSGYNPASTTIAVPTTPLTAVTDTRVLLNFTNAGIYDAAAQNNMVTGGTTQASISAYKWSPTSMKFNGATTDYLYAPVNSADTFGSGNWTIEGWFNFSSVSGNQEMFSKETLNAAQAGIRCVLTTSKVQFQLSSTGSTYATTILCSTTLTTGVWYYLAFVRNGTAITVYLNGTSDGTGSFTGALYETNTFWALASRGLYSAGTSFNGYIQDFRITKGVARTITSSPTSAFPTQ